MCVAAHTDTFSLTQTTKCFVVGICVVHAQVCVRVHTRVSVRVPAIVCGRVGAKDQVVSSSVRAHDLAGRKRKEEERK